MGAYTPLHVITPERISPIGHQNANAVNGPSTGVVHGILRAMLSDLAAVTREQLEVLALDVPDQLADAEIPLWRSSGKAKYHWADKRSVCKYLPGDRHWGPTKPSDRKPPPVSERVAALGFAIPLHGVCTNCAERVTISASADAFMSVAAELSRAEQWVQDGLDGATAGDWTWLHFARWRARQPLLGDRWTNALRVVRGPGWAATTLALTGAIGSHRSAADVATRRLVESIGDNPGRSALLERAIRMVETDSSALKESAAILQIAGCKNKPDIYQEMIGAPGSGYKQSSPWHLTAGTWRDATKRGGSINVNRLADYFDDEFPHVHDLGALPCCATHSPGPIDGDCVHTWALRSAQAHRRAQVAEWIQRLELAAGGLIATDGDATDDCTHLLCVPWWPLTRDAMASIAYLSQFDVVSGPHLLDGRDGYGGYNSSSVVILRVPAWAASHVAELPSPMRTEPITDDRHQAVRIARRSGVAIVSDEFGNRRKPSAMVTEARMALAETKSRSNYYYEHRHRPLAPGSVPPELYGKRDDAEWTAYAVRRALEPGASFIYGSDEMALLSMGLAENSRWRVRGRIEVEVQTECPSHDAAGPHLCEVDGVVEFVRSNGTITFTPEGLRNGVTIPAAYIVGLTFTR